MPVPVVLGMLHAVALPPPSPFGNGETEFADMRAAYDALPDTTKQAIDPLVVEHDVFWSRGHAGRTMCVTAFTGRSNAGDSWSSYALASLKASSYCT